VKKIDKYRIINQIFFILL